MRLAAGGLKNLLAILKPTSAWDGAMRYGPDLGFAAMAALTAPGGPNALVGAEDLALSLAGSTAGALVGHGVGRRLAKGLNAERAAERIGQSRQAADLLLSAPLQMFGPRPALQGAIEQSFAGEQAQAQAQAQVRQQQTEEQLLASLLGIGGLMVPGAYTGASALLS